MCLCALKVHLKGPDSTPALSSAGVRSALYCPVPWWDSVLFEVQQNILVAPH